jgi:hypothetical protein
MKSPIDLIVSRLELKLEDDVVVAYELQLGRAKRGEEIQVLRRGFRTFVFPDTDLGERRAILHFDLAGLEAATVLGYAFVGDLPKSLELLIDEVRRTRSAVSDTHCLTGMGQVGGDCGRM